MRGNGLEASQDETCLLERVETSHHPLPVAAALYSQLLLLITLVCGGFILPAVFKNEESDSTDTFSSIIYLHIIVWVIVTILTWYVKAEHKSSRILGYHEFYDSTRHLHRVAFYSMSGGNVLILIISCVTHNFCLGGGISPCSLNIDLSPANYLQIVMVLEVGLALPLLIKHIVEVFRFNQSMLPPDVFVAHSMNDLEQRELLVGIRGADNMERLLNQQADQLKTLNHRNEVLYQQLFSLTQRQQSL